MKRDRYVRTLSTGSTIEGAARRRVVRVTNLKAQRYPRLRLSNHEAKPQLSMNSTMNGNHESGCRSCQRKITALSRADRS